MFQKWNKSEIIKGIICLVLYVGFEVLAQVPGFVSAGYWVFFPIVAAFFMAGPVTCLMSMKRGFGSAAVLPLIWFILMRCAGEIGLYPSWIYFALLLVVAEVVRKLIGYDKLLSIRVCVPILSLIPISPLMGLFFMKETYLSMALEEMGSADYVATLEKLGSPWILILLVVLCAAVGLLSEFLSEKVMKIKE